MIIKYVDANLDEPDKAISGNEPYKPKSNNGMCQKQAYNVFFIYGNPGQNYT